MQSDELRDGLRRYAVGVTGRAERSLREVRESLSEQEDVADEPNYAELTRFDVADPVNRAANHGDGEFVPYVILGTDDDRYAGFLVDGGTGQGVADIRDNMNGETEPDTWNWSWGPGNADAITAGLQRADAALDGVTITPQPSSNPRGVYNVYDNSFAATIAAGDTELPARENDALLFGLLGDAEFYAPDTALTTKDGLGAHQHIDFNPHDIQLQKIADIAHEPRPIDLDDEEHVFTYTGGTSGRLQSGSAEFATLTDRINYTDERRQYRFEDDSGDPVVIPIAPAHQSQRARKTYRADTEHNTAAYTDGGLLRAQKPSWLDIIWEDNIEPKQADDDIAYIAALQKNGRLGVDDPDELPVPMADPYEGYLRIDDAAYRVNPATVQDVPWQPGDELVVTDSDYGVPDDPAFQ